MVHKRFNNTLLFSFDILANEMSWKYEFSFIKLLLYKDLKNSFKSKVSLNFNIIGSSSASKAKKN